MDKTINAIGLMSGTSMDGIDASIIRSDGERNIEVIGDLYLKYDPELKNNLNKITKKINSLEDLKINLDEYQKIEREITIRHSQIALKILREFNTKVNIIGFHGQTILHNPKEKYSIQMGNGKLLSQLLNIDVVYQFRKNDITNGGEGAPLTPIYHHFLKKKLNINKPVLFLNLGGIANYTVSNKDNFFAKDAGPGNCLMDIYIKKTTKKDFDESGNIAKGGKIDTILVNNIIESEIYNSVKKHSLDVKDFDINFVRGMQIEDAMATLNFLTSKIISENIKKVISENYIIILCGGGRKNQTLVSNLKQLLKNKIYNIDDFKIDGDFVESQAFAYLSIRSLYKKNISYPNTTKVNIPVSGGELVKSS